MEVVKASTTLEAFMEVMEDSVEVVKASTTSTEASMDVVEAS